MKSFIQIIGRFSLAKPAFVSKDGLCFSVLMMSFPWKCREAVQCSEVEHWLWNQPDWFEAIFWLMRLWVSYLTPLCLSFLISKMQLKITYFKELLWTLKELIYVKCLRYRLANRCYINVTYCSYYIAWLTQAECAEHANVSVPLLRWQQSIHSLHDSVFQDLIIVGTDQSRAKGRKMAT